MKPEQAANRAFLETWARSFLPDSTGSKMQRLQTASNQVFARAQAVAKLADCTCDGLSEKKGILFSILTGYTTPEGGRVVMHRHAHFPYDTVIDEPSRVVSWARAMRARNKMQAAALGYTEN